MKKLAQGFNTAAQDSNPGSLSRESGGLPLSHCALQCIVHGSKISLCCTKLTYFRRVPYRFWSGVHTGTGTGTGVTCDGSGFGGIREHSARGQ